MKHFNKGVCKLIANSKSTTKFQIRVRTRAIINSDWTVSVKVFCFVTHIVATMQRAHTNAKFSSFFEFICALEVSIIAGNNSPDSSFEVLTLKRVIQ